MKVSGVCNSPLSSRHSPSPPLIPSSLSLRAWVDGLGLTSRLWCSLLFKSERFSALTLAAAGTKYSPEHLCSNMPLFAPAKIYLLIKSPSYHSTNLLGRFTDSRRADYIEILVECVTFSVLCNSTMVWLLCNIHTTECNMFRYLSVYHNYQIWTAFRAGVKTTYYKSRAI